MRTFLSPLTTQPQSKYSNYQPSFSTSSAQIQEGKRTRMPSAPSCALPARFPAPKRGPQSAANPHIQRSRGGHRAFPPKLYRWLSHHIRKRETSLPIRLRNKPHYGAGEPVPHVGEGVALILPHQFPSHAMQCASLLHQRHCVDLLDLIIGEQHLESRYSSIITRAKLTILIGIVSSKSR